MPVRLDKQRRKKEDNLWRLKEILTIGAMMVTMLILGIILGAMFW
jgi:hypothetical protein